MQGEAASRALSASVLVLNRAYMAVHVVNVRRAFGLLYRELAEVIDLDQGQFANYDFVSWRLVSDLRRDELRGRTNGWSTDAAEDWVRSVNFFLQVPRVIRLYRYDRVPQQTLRFNRRTLFARDRHLCQYCGDAKPLSQLSLDHVIPRSRGGQTTWENTVCCCLPCNTQKGNRTPQEARMRLLSRPAKPRFNPMLARKLDNPKYESWRAFLAAAAGANL